MASVTFNVVLFVAMLYFYSAGNLFAAVAFAFFLVYRVFQNRLTRIVSVVSRLDSVPSETACNTALTCRFAVEHVLSHPSLDALFQRLRTGGKIQPTDVSEWRRTLVANYERKYKRNQPFEEVRFHVKNNLVFMNGEPHFGDTLYHAIEIPYSLGEDGKEGEKSFLTPNIEVKLEIRLLVVNGMLVLQLGEFDRQSSPKILKDGSLAVYQTYVTLTTFPLMYFGYQLGLPIRYLNLSSHATESYKNHWHEWQTKTKRPFWKRKPGMFDDWRRLHQDLAAYRILSEHYQSSDYSWSKWKKFSDAFESRRDALLKAEKFTTFHTKTDDDWRYPDMGQEYSNDYLYVFFQNLNLRREFAAEHWFTDYYEEMP